MPDLSHVFVEIVLVIAVVHPIGIELHDVDYVCARIVEDQPKVVENLSDLSFTGAVTHIPRC